MTIRPATETDAAALAALSIEVWLGTYLRWGVNDTFARHALDIHTPQIFRDLLADPDQVFLVSDNQMGIDGYIRLSRHSSCPVDDGPSTEIATLYVQPRHHGSGIGGRLLEAGLDTCMPRAVWLAVNSLNSEAIGFYRAKGFETLGETAYRIGTQSFPNLVMAITPV